MNYEEARAYLEESVRYGGEIGLGKIYALLEELDHPEDDLQFVHIAGTNGKGSVLAYVSTTMTLAGYRVGRYISPTLYSYEERFQVDGVPITKKDYVTHMECIAKAVARMEARGLDMPSPFEIETVLAFLYFKSMHCDLVVLECGLGGLLDATNVIKNTKVAVLTSVSMDHMEYLGDTLGDIAANKSGIIKPLAQVVTTKQEAEAEVSIRNKCLESGNNLIIADYTQAVSISSDWHGQRFSYGKEIYEVSLPGVPQIQNATLAIEVLHALQVCGYTLTEEQIKAGLKAAVWNGRFTILREKPYFLVDGAHNPDAAQKFVKSLQNCFPERRIIYIIGMLKDKAYEEVIRITSPLASQIIAMETPDNDRALPAAELAEAIRPYHPQVQTAASIPDAVHRSMELAGPEDVIAAFGSLSFIGDITKIVNDYEEKEND